MLSDLLVHDHTANNLQAFIAKPSHVILLIGPTGVGKYTLARQLSAELLTISLDKLDSHPFVIHLVKEPDKQNIPIDSIREVIKMLGLKVPGQASIRRIVLIENAQYMTQEAQNALLKSLEEPDEHTVFILTAGQSSGLLPTVISRSTKVDVKPVGLEAAKDFFKGDNSAVEAAWRLSGGLPGLMAALLSKEDSEIKFAAAQAKKLLQQDKYHRILDLDALSRDKAGFAVFLEGLVRVIQALYQASANKEKSKQTTALLTAMKLVLDSQEALAANALPRLVALRLALKLPI